MIQLLQAQYCEICASIDVKRVHDRCNTHECTVDYIEEMQKHLVLKLNSAYGHGRNILAFQRRILTMLYPIYQREYPVPFELLLGKNESD